MTTSVYALAESIDERLKELTSIVAYAQSAIDKDENLYDILCRSGCVLEVSALEGFLKDLDVAIQSDLNLNVSSFSKMPKSMQRDFTKKIVHFEEVPDHELQKRANQLIKFFEINSVKIDMSAFTYKENVNKNPSSNIVDSTFYKYGINSILNCLSGSKFEAVFDNDSATNVVLMRDIKRMRATLFKFPYKEIPSKFSLKDWAPVKGQLAPNTSLWHTFIENILGRRHSVVHADTMANPTAWQVFKEDTNKLEILFHGLLLAAASLIGRDIKKT